MKCKNCGEEHPTTTSNCCWVHCKCGKEICGQCGSSNISKMEMPEDDDDAGYWCCLKCDDCELQGCAMCI